MCNNDYIGEVKKGNALQIATLNNPTIIDYTDDTVLTYERIKGDEKTLNINQCKSFSFGVDDIVNYQSAINLIESSVSNSSYALADELDKYIVSLYPTESPLEATTTNSGFEKMLLEVVTTLDEQNARDDRYLVLKPSICNQLVSYLAEKMTNNNDVLSSGYVGKIYGLNIYKSNNVSGGVFGTRSAITLAKQITSVETLRSPTRYENEVRGLLCFGALNARPELTNTITFS